MVRARRKIAVNGRSVARSSTEPCPIGIALVTKPSARYDPSAKTLLYFAMVRQGLGRLGLVRLGGDRAWTEERHLLRDPDYQRSCRRVRCRFIPYVW